ncbi:hypothetical protein SDC9_176706 [bioreactor metagenome]|uniref:Uncharacterized protein n=1 Tax=bioreactor metagenome TaxID=1076179 RepID=A0A645GRB2_9ZZZZ
MLTVGTRLANGSVLTDINFFTVKLNDTTTVSLNVRQEDAKMQVIGNFNSEARFTTLENTEQSILQACGRGYFVVAILGVGQEPTNHALRDIAKLKQEFETWGRPIVMLFTDEQQAKRFNPAEFPELPTTVKYGIDKSQAIQNEILDNMKLTASKGLPIFIIADSFNRIVFVAQGYSIGLGEQIHKVIHGL